MSELMVDRVKWRQTTERKESKSEVLYEHN